MKLFEYEHDFGSPLFNIIIGGLINVAVLVGVVWYLVWLFGAVT